MFDPQAPTTSVYRALGAAYRADFQLPAEEPVTPLWAHAFHAIARAVVAADDPVADLASFASVVTTAGEKLSACPLCGTANKGEVHKDCANREAMEASR